MCLPDFIEFRNIPESNPIIGYRNWINPTNSLRLKSLNQDYYWKTFEGPHPVLDRDSGLYSYNNYNYKNYYYNDYYNYNYNYNYYNNYYYYNNNDYNNYNYTLGGIILQWGKIAFHKEGYRSEYAKIDKLFTIRKLDARGPQYFLDWIDDFNQHIEKIAKEYNCLTIPWQDFFEGQSK